MSEQQQNEYLNDPELKGCWAVIQAGSDDQYMPEDRILEWVSRVIAQKQMAQKFADSDIKKQLYRFMKQVHQLERSAITNVMFKFQEAVQFFTWLISNNQKNVQLQEEPQNNTQKHMKQSKVHSNNGKQKQQSMKNDSNIVKNESKHSSTHKVDNNKSQVEQQQRYHNQSKAELQKHKKQQQHAKKQTQKNHKQISKQAQKHGKHEQNTKKSHQVHEKYQQKQAQQQFLYPGGNKANNQQQQQTNQRQQQVNEIDNQFADTVNKGETQKQQQSGVTKSYREYLSIVFDHYCRMSYATGNDPTFEQIQQKTQVMTINKFMIFCKDFGIVKLNGMNRNILVEMFKKNSEFYKDMNYQQFISVLVKISYMVYSPDNQDPQSQNSKQFEQFLLFLQVNNLSTFKKKAVALGISLKSRNPNQNIPKKIAPTNYKFKYENKNQKTQEQQQQPKQERKRIQSQNKLKVALNQSKNALSKKNIVKAQHQARNVNERPQIKSVQVTKKLALGPPIPPVRKVSNNVKTKPEIDPTAGVTGYANIHKLKMLGKQGQIDSKLKLNAVVEEAKKIIQRNLNGFDDDSQYVPSNRVSSYGRDTPNSNFGYARDYTGQGQENYSNLSHSQRHSYSQRNINEFDEIPISKRNYAPHGHSYLQKKPKQTHGNAELDGIIDNDSDHDQFLQEHLNREKKTGQINQRIEKKIKQIGMKQQPY